MFFFFVVFFYSIFLRCGNSNRREEKKRKILERGNQDNSDNAGLEPPEDAKLSFFSPRDPDRCDHGSRCCGLAPGCRDD